MLRSHRDETTHRVREIKTLVFPHSVPVIVLDVRVKLNTDFLHMSYSHECVEFVLSFPFVVLNYSYFLHVF